MKPLLSDSWLEKPAFGTALEEHLKRSNRDIALPIEACVMMLLETGMKEEVGTADEKGNTPKSFFFFLMSENVIGGLFGTVFSHVTLFQ